MRKSQCLRFVVMITLAVVITSSLLPAADKGKPQQRGVRSVDPGPASAVSAGPYYALVIGNNNYRYLPKLQTAVYDATEVAKLLKEGYGFRPPKVLLNATRNQILSAINEYRRSLPEKSNLVIYFAGHGLKDEHTNKAYWLPIDAESDNHLNWISASTITEEVSAISSSHILVISDSCYAGELMRDTRTPQAAFTFREHGVLIRRMLESRSRTVIASGRNEPVRDGGSGGHSPFAYVVLESLRRIDEDTFTAADLFQRYIQPGVAGRSEQVPQYMIIRNSGHEYGDFVFSRPGAAKPTTADSDGAHPAIMIGPRQIPVESHNPGKHRSWKSVFGKP